MAKSKDFLVKFEQLDICERDMDLIPYDDPDSGAGASTGYWATRSAIRGKKRGVSVYKKTKLGRLNRQIDDLKFQKRKAKHTAKLDKEKHAKNMWARRKEMLLKQKLGLDPTEGKLYKADVQYKLPKGRKPGRYSQQNRQQSTSGMQRAQQTNFQQVALPVANNSRLTLQHPDYEGDMDTRETEFGSRSRASRVSKSIGPSPSRRLPRGARQIKRVGPGSRRLLTQG